MIYHERYEPLGRKSRVVRTNRITYNTDGAQIAPVIGFAACVLTYHINLFDIVINYMTKSQV